MNMLTSGSSNSNVWEAYQETGMSEGNVSKKVVSWTTCIHGIVHPTVAIVIQIK